jgi:HlyD family secretion protein
MKKIVRIALVIFAVGLIAGGYYLYSGYQSSQEAQAAADDIETVIIEDGTLVSTISAMGKVRSNQTATLTWKTNGTVEDVNFEAGDEVQTGDVLSTLAQTSLPQSVILAQADLINVYQALDDLYTDTEIIKTNALKDISKFTQEARDAQYLLDNYTISSDQADMDAIEAYDLMKEELDRASDAFDPYKHLSSSNDTRQDYLEEMNEAQSDLDAAVKRLGYEYELEVAEANLEKAREDFEKYKDGPDPADVVQLETKIAAAEATLSQAWIEVPFDATITDVNAQPGDQVYVNIVAFQLDDVSKLFVEVEVSEIDINQVEIGQDVTITLDAIRGVEYHGNVIEVARNGTENGGVVNFSVTVEFNDADQDVRPGMTAEVEILVTQGDAVLLVPNPAI